MAVGWRILLFFVALALFGTLFQVAYVQYISLYSAINGLSRQARSDLMLRISSKSYQILFERQNEPQLERLRRRVVARFILGLVAMFAFVLFVAR